MTVREFAARHGYQILTESSAVLEREIRDVYACDLLSWAMAKVPSGAVWSTVHTNLNVIAVASLTEAACVVIPEGIAVEPETIARANREDVPVLSAKDSAAAVVIHAWQDIMAGLDGIAGRDPVAGRDLVANRDGTEP